MCSYITDKFNLIDIEEDIISIVGLLMIVSWLSSEKYKKIRSFNIRRSRNKPRVVTTVMSAGACETNSSSADNSCSAKLLCSISGEYAVNKFTNVW